MGRKRVMMDWRIFGLAAALVAAFCGMAPGVCVPGGPGCGGCGCNNCPGHYACPPNAEQFGFYETVWRSWPGEVRTDVTFPQSVGVEKVRTPRGEVPQPLPKGTLSVPAAPDAVPGSPGGLPPMQGLPAMPFQSGAPGALQPGGGQSLPGLPLEEAIPPLQNAPVVPPSDQPAPKPTPTPEPNKGSRIQPRPDEQSLKLTADPAHDSQAEAAGATAGHAAAQTLISRNKETAGPMVAAPQRPPIAAALAPLGLDGYCPVELVSRTAWVAGDPRWSVERDGRTYRFAGEAQRERFLADPRRYAPVCAGRDPVVLVEQGRNVPGRTEFCVMCKDRLYMFSAATSLAKFREDPSRYCSKIGDTTLR